MGWEDAIGLGSGAKIWKAEYTMPGPSVYSPPGMFSAADILDLPVYATLPDPSLDTPSPSLAEIPPGSIISSIHPGITFLDEGAGGGGAGGGGSGGGGTDAISSSTETEEFTDVDWDPTELNVLDETTTIEEDTFYRLTGEALSQNLSTRFTNCLDSDMMSGFPGYYNPASAGAPEYWLGMEMAVYDYITDPGGFVEPVEPDPGAFTIVPMDERDAGDQISTDDPWEGFNVRASGSIGLSAIDYDAHYVDPDQGKFRLDDDIKMFAHSCSPLFALPDPDYNVVPSLGYGVDDYTTESPWTYPGDPSHEEIGLNEKFGYTYISDDLDDSVTEKLQMLMVAFIENMQVGVIPRHDTTRRVPAPHLTNEMLEKIVGKEIKETMIIDGITSPPISTSGTTIYSSVVTSKIEAGGYDPGGSTGGTS